MEKLNLPILWIVIPCYNEREVLPVTTPQFLDELNNLISMKKVSKRQTTRLG